MRPLRSPAVQATLAWLLAGWLKLCIATTRWRHDNRAAAEEIWDAGGGVIVCFWHSRIALSPAYFIGASVVAEVSSVRLRVTLIAPLSTLMNLMPLPRDFSMSSRTRSNTTIVSLIE